MMNDREGPLVPLMPWIDSSETLFSLASRHHGLWGSWKSSWTASHLFGGIRVGVQHDFPSGLAYFEQRTGAAFGAAVDVALARTLLRFYAPFLERSEVVSAVDAMQGASVKHLKTRLGLARSGFDTCHPLKVCPDCVREDLRTFGWTCWRVPDQFPGVWVCARHGSLLRGTLAKTGAGRWNWCLPGALSSWELQPNLDNYSVAESFGKFVLQMLNFRAPNMNFLPVTLHSAVQRALVDAGLISVTGRFRLSEAASDFYGTCASLRVLPDLEGLPRSPEQTRIQLHDILRRRSCHPLRILAFLYWIFSDAGRLTRALVASSSDPPGPAMHAISVEAAAVERLSVGVRPSAVAKQLGVSVYAVTKWGASAGYPIQLRPKRIKGSLKEHILLDLRAGKSASSVARRRAVSLTTVYRLLGSQVGLRDDWKRAKIGDSGPR